MGTWGRFRGVRLRELDRLRPMGSALPELVDIRLDEAGFRRMAAAFEAFPGAVYMAALEAADRTRRFARNQLVRQFRELLTLKPAYISRGIKSRKPRDTGNGIEASVLIATRNIPLGRYAIRPKRPPQLKGVRVRDRRRVTYRLRTSGPLYGDTAFEPGAATPLFMARMKSGHIGAFYRTDKGSRGDVRQEYAPSLQYHAHADGFLPRVSNLSARRFEEIFVGEARAITGVEA